MTNWNEKSHDELVEILTQLEMVVEKVRPFGVRLKKQSDEAQPLITTILKSLKDMAGTIQGLAIMLEELKCQRD